MTRAKTTAASEPSGYLGRTRLKRAGGSLIMTVPASARNLLGLTEGQEMTVRVEGQSVIAEPVPEPAVQTLRRVRRPKYTIEELVAGMPETPRADKEVDWMEAPPVGREIW